METRKSFAASLASQQARSRAVLNNPPPQYLSLLTGRKGLDRGRETVIPVDGILYIFTSSALSRGLINTSSIWQQISRRDRVYLRTSKDAFFTRFRSLSQLRHRLDPRLFFPVNQSLLVNVQKITDLDFGGRVKQVGVTVGGGATEWLTVSRRSVRDLYAPLGIPERG